ncbi:MAG: TIGR04283 family arsenosugar biosynthesis glycosyltransferase [Deltaproteobacteria bacterium]|nr:TIGR04283 family arsenosugar biosynthesis glycosyltransferase [Deltaproteobacteria bacterium]
MPIFSVVIPTLNEESILERTLKSIGQDMEIIVVDAGSSDSTIKVAGKFTERVILSGKGRGSQMDSGARMATGDILLFLHADTRLPDDWREKVAEALKNAKVIGGGFRLKIDSKNFSFRIIEAMVNLRSRYLGLVYGDQAIFVKKQAFLQVGGFKGLPLMEDVDLMGRLKKQGKVVLLDEEIITSPRQWERKGVLRTTLRNWLFLSLYYLGVSPERLYKKYYA